MKEKVNKYLFLLIFSSAMVLIMGACSQLINSEDGKPGENGIDGNNAVSLNVDGTVYPNDYLLLEHNLGRDDLTFTAQFVKNGIIYDWNDYKEMFSCVVAKDFACYTNLDLFSNKAVSNIATACHDSNIAVAFKDIDDDNKGKFNVYNHDGYGYKHDSIIGCISPSVGSIVFTEDSYLYDNGIDLSNMQEIGINMLSSGYVVINFMIPGLETNNGHFLVYDAEGNFIDEKIFFSPGNVIPFSGVGSCNSDSEYAILLDSLMPSECIIFAYKDESIGGGGEYNIYNLEDPNNISLYKEDTSFCNNPVDNIKVKYLFNGACFIIVYNDLTENKAKFNMYSFFNGNFEKTVTFSDTTVDLIDVSVNEDVFIIAFNDGASANFVTYNSSSGDIICSKKSFCDAGVNILSTAAFGKDSFIIYYEAQSDSEVYFKVYDYLGNLKNQKHIELYDSNNSFHSLSLNNEDVVLNYLRDGANSNAALLIYGETCLSLEKVNNNQVRLWNRTDEVLEFMLSVNQ